MNQKDELQLLRNAFDMLGAATAALTGCLVWAYLMGRCCEYVYLVPFRATWMIDQFSTAQFVGSGWPVIPLYLLGAVFMAQDAQVDPVKKFRAGQFLWSTLATLILCVGSILFVFHELRQNPTLAQQAHILKLLTGADAFFILAAGFILFHALKKKLFGWNMESALTALLVFFISIGYIPATLASDQSLQDFYSATSTLPQVVMKTPPAQAADLRLLLHANGFFYAVDLLSPRHDIRIFAAADVAAVYGPVPAQTNGR